ncbi:MAG: 2Fe-2S iron-sulfur cluster-binding protein [Steroidobacteraceae bacterium]
MRARITLLPAQQVIVTEDDETILDAALRAGVNLPHSCRGGHCASCRARIVGGSIQYRNGRPLGLMEQEERDGYALLCQALPAVTDVSVQVRVIKPVAEVHVQHLPCRIERLQPLAPDVMAPHDAKFLELHVRRVAHGEFTSQIFGEASLKTLLRLEGPLGQLWFREDSERPAILVGGGTGYAPLRSMLRHLLERGDQRPLHLYWGAQTREGLYEDSVLREWCVRYPNLTYTPVLTVAPENEDWIGRRGWVHTAVIEDHPSLRNFDVYAAGPPAMIETLRTDFSAHGLPPAQLFFDSFDFSPQGK